MKNTKKPKSIKAEKYKENEELELEENFDEIEEYEDELVLEDDLDDELEEQPKKKNSRKKKSTSKKKTTKKSSRNKKKKNDDEFDDEFEDEEPKVSTELFMKIFNIVFVVIMIAMVLISIDVILVARYQKGPYFAIKTATYKDGGTKVYYGLGYKVIKYNQLEGRKDIQLGFWNMPYSVTPTPVEDIDIAIEFQKDYEKTIKRYHNQYLKLTSTVKEINVDDNELILEYTDLEGGKYTFQFICKVSSEEDSFTDLEENDKVTVKGSVSEFKLKTEKEANRAYLNDCFIEE